MRRASRRLWIVLLPIVIALPLADLAAGPTGAAVTTFTDPTVVGPNSIVLGPDGNMWFTNAGNSSIGQITVVGTRVISNFTDGSIAHPNSITDDLAGNLWFTNAANNSIGEITTDGTVSNFVDPTISSPTGIVAGSDGNMWFTNAGSSSIGQITTDGTGTVTKFAAASISYPTSITAGPDGALWFTNAGNGSIGRITTDGTVTNFTDPSISYPTSITPGPDGAFWFTNAGNGSIGRITTGGTIAHFTNPSISSPRDIATGPDGALWFTNAGNSSIGRITTGGTVSNFTAPSISAPIGIAAGPDSAMWFTNSGSSTIGRITAQPPGVPSSVNAAPFLDGSALVGWAAPPDNGSPITGYVVRPYLDGAPQPVRVFNSTSTRELVKNLKNGRSYQFTVAARNAGGTGQASAKTAPIIVGSPGRPQNVTAVKVAAGSLKVSFGASNSNGAPVTSYTATCTSSDGGVTNTKSGAASPITVAGLTAGKTYRCTVKGTNSRGTGPSSFPSAPVTA